MLGKLIAIPGSLFPTNAKKSNQLGARDPIFRKNQRLDREAVIKLKKQIQQTALFE
jgi:hypothetical protein